MMNKFLGGLATAALVAVTAPVIAAPFTFNLAGAAGTVTGSGTNTKITYNTNNSNPSAADNIQMVASGWSSNRDLNPDKLEKAEVIKYGADNGLGVKSTPEDGSSPEHTVDNLVKTDFILLEFNKAVNLDTAWFTPYDVNNNGVGDSDATILWGNTGPVVGNDSDSYFNSLGREQISDASGIENIMTLAYANKWLVSSSLDFTGTTCLTQYNPDKCSGFDGFKLREVSGHTPNGAVPEPATWAMMIAGFGFVGASLRRRNRKLAMA